MERILVNKDGKVELERAELELVPEFAGMLTLKYNKQPGDLEGKKRVRAFKEFTYMWFMNSYNSPYREYSKEERISESLLAADLPETYEFSTEYKLAEKKYLSLIETRTLKLIRAAEHAIDKIRSYLESVDFITTTDNGALKNKPTDVIKIIGELDSIADGLEKLANRSKKEKQEFASTRGAQEAGWLMEMEKFQITPKKNGDTEAEDTQSDF